jgi:predicted Ser/Thr protein kinase
MIGRLLDGRYKILQVLGSGGFSETYLAQDTRRPGSPTCVVKLLKPNTNNPNSLQISRRLFQSEAETLERLGNHSQIPRLLAYFEEDQEFYLVQEYIKGNLLSTEFTPEKPYSEEQTVQLLRDVLLTLAFVHEQGVIHRDVKPDNLIRRWEDDKLVLVDFGAVKKIWNRNAAQNQVAGTIIGTPGYMATEQGRGKPRPSSDIYALGMVAVQAITGITPMSLQEDSETGETIWQQYAKASPGLVAIIDKMIRYHFRDRFQSAKDVLAALDQLTNAAPGFMPNLNTIQPVVEEEEEETAPAHREETFYGQVLVPPAQPPTFLVSEEPPAVPRDATLFIPAPAPVETAAANPPAFFPGVEQVDKPAQPATVLSAEEPTLSQLYPTPAAPPPIPPQQPRVVPAPPLPPPIVKPTADLTAEKTASKAPVLVGAGVLAALLVGTVGFFALKPSGQGTSPTVTPSASVSPGAKPTVPEPSVVKPVQSAATSTTSTTEKTAVVEPPIKKPVLPSSKPPTATAVKPPVLPSTATEKPVIQAPKPTVAAVTLPKKVAIQSPAPQPKIKSDEPEKKPRRKPIVAVRTPEKKPDPPEPPKKVAIKPVQKPPTPEKKPTVVLRPVRPEGSASPFKSQSAPVNTGSSDGLRPAATPVQPPN